MFKAVIVALCVGTILNLINQFGAVFGDESLNLFKVGLTYSVPFFVYLLGAKSSAPEIESPQKIHAHINSEKNSKIYN